MIRKTAESRLKEVFEEAKTFDAATTQGLVSNFKEAVSGGDTDAAWKEITSRLSEALSATRTRGVKMITEGYTSFQTYLDAEFQENLNLIERYEAFGRFMDGAESMANKTGRDSSPLKLEIRKDVTTSTRPPAPTIQETDEDEVSMPKAFGKLKDIDGMPRHKLGSS